MRVALDIMPDNNPIAASLIERLGAREVHLYVAHVGSGAPRHYRVALSRTATPNGLTLSHLSISRPHDQPILDEDCRAIADELLPGARVLGVASTAWHAMTVA